MFSGGDYDVVGRWLENFVRSHAKREDPRAEAILDAGPTQQGRHFAVRVRVGDRAEPPPDGPALVLPFDEVAVQRGNLAWCASLATRVRELVRQASLARPGSRQSA